MIVEHGIPVRIHAPDAASAFLLERRLVHLQPFAVAHGDEWSVELRCHDTEQLPDLTAVVRSWLRESNAEATTIEYDGGLRTERIERASNLVATGLQPGCSSG